MHFNTIAVVLVCGIFLQAMGDVLASVDDATLTWEDLIEMVGGEEYTSYLGITSSAVAEEILDGWVREELFVRAAEDAGLASDPYVVEALEQARRQILLEVYLADLMNGLEVSRLEVENYINAWSESYSKEVNTRHILVDDPNLANSILARLRSGSDFAELATQYSICPSSADGGHLGWMSRGQAVLPFMEAVFQLNPGQFSDVVETNLGYHVIEILDARSLTPPPTAEQVLEIATMELTAALQEEAVLSVLEELEVLHTISIYPDRLMDHL